MSNKKNNSIINKVSINKVSINKVSYADIDFEFNILIGGILTIIDAIIIDKNQNKATKDLLRSKFSKTRTTLWRIAIGKFSSINKKQNP